MRCGTQFYVHLKGGVNSLLVTPVELVRTRLMLQFDRDPRSNPSSVKGPVDCIRRIVRRSGVRSMWQASARAAWKRGQGRVFQAGITVVCVVYLVHNLYGLAQPRQKWLIA